MTPEVSNDGAFRLLAARVRGVSHKHEGLNCDDSYAIGQAGAWSLIAVGDGAGSHRFSRVGSKVACEAAVDRLRSELGEHRIQPRTETDWAHAWGRDPVSAVFLEDDLEHVRRALQEAAMAAMDAVEEAAREREDSPEHQAVLDGRRPRVSDFSTTLLMVAHTGVLYKEKLRSLAMACQIGDGYVAAISQDWSVRCLSQPDHGAFGAETKFLARGPDLEPVALGLRTFPLFEPIRALFVMTDGVADIYFPPESEMLRLFGDLTLNHVLPVPDFPDGATENREIAEALRDTRVPTHEAVTASGFLTRMNYVGPEQNKVVELPLISAYAEKLGVSIRDVLESRGRVLPATGMKMGTFIRPPMPPEECLLHFLDCLEVRGQRDDRTLVVLHPEASVSGDRRSPSS
jgi:hypothetical protein